jgi:hypothetical protein
VTDAPAKRSRLPVAALGFAIAAALSAWNPLSAPFGLAVGIASLGLAVRALRAGYARTPSAAAIALSAAAAVGSALVLALTAGVGRDLGGQPVVAVKPGVAGAELDAAAERTRAARERARRELEALEGTSGPSGPSGRPAAGEKGGQKGAPTNGR